MRMLPGFTAALAIGLALAPLRPGCCDARTSSSLTPREVSLPSPEPSGDPINDQIWLTFHPARGLTDQPAPAVVLLHPLGGDPTHFAPRFALYLSQQGIATALMVLPYHTRRARPGEQPVHTFASPEAARAARAMSQSAADVSAVLTWLGRQPGVDSRRIGIVGISLGAIIAHLAMGRDDRLTAGVAVLGGGNLAELRRTSLVFRLRHRRDPSSLDAAAAERLRLVDPLTDASRNRPRRVLMIEAARDLLVPPRHARQLWEALGRPPIRWVDTNHFGIALAPRSLMKASAAYLHSVWASSSVASEPLLPVRAITLKVGTVMGLESAVTPAVQWQAISFATRRDHMSLLHADLGWSGRGPFLGLAATLNAFVDLGIAHRFHSGSLRPYLSFHVVF
jgi:dienelactone hydrolase